MAAREYKPFVCNLGVHHSVANSSLNAPKENKPKKWSGKPRKPTAISKLFMLISPIMNSTLLIVVF